MTERYQIYKCKHCGNVVEVLEAHAGTLVCCGDPMVMQAANTMEASTEKHIPVIEETAEGYVVKVGSTPHPMEADHYIELIELEADGRVYGRHLNPGDAPSYEFYVKEAKKVTARAYCNKHGLWQGN